MDTHIKNKKAIFDYNIFDEFEAGIVLTGSEVKSLRLKRCSLTSAHVKIFDMQAYVYGMEVQEYEQANTLNHPIIRPRKLLLHKREIRRLYGKMQQKGFTLIPLDIHFNERGRAKMTIALATGKSNFDKRGKIRDRDENLKLQRLQRAAR